MTKSNAKNFIENINFAIKSNASLLIDIINAKQCVDQRTSYSSNHFSDNELNNSNVLFLFRFEIDQEIVQSLTWNTLVTNTMNNDALFYEFSMSKDFWKTSRFSINIDLVIKERKSIVLDEEKYWIMKWEKSYIYESEIFDVH